MVNSHLELFEVDEKLEPKKFKEFKAMKKDIRKQELAINQEEKKVEEKLKIERMKEAKAEAEKNKKGKQFGKMPMIRSQPPKVKRVEKKK